MLWRPSCPPFCKHATDTSEINFNMLNQFLDLKNLGVATKIMFLTLILKKILRTLSLWRPSWTPSWIFQFPQGRQGGIIQFLVKDNWNDKNLYQIFVRTIFRGSRLGTQTIESISVYIGPSPWDREKEKRNDRQGKNNPHPHLQKAQ